MMEAQAKEFKDSKKLVSFDQAIENVSKKSESSIVTDNLAKNKLTGQVVAPSPRSEQTNKPQIHKLSGAGLNT